MDIFAADTVSPFPDSGDLIYDALFSTTDILSHHYHNPQKLRPIRPNGISSPLHDPNLQTILDAPGSGHYYGFPFLGSSLDDDENNVDDDNSSGSMKEPGSRKRSKRKDGKLENFVQNLVMEMMEKQERMHKQLVDMIEQKESERIMREEAWRRETMERIKNDEEARAEEKSRSLAIISFIQNLIGHEIQIPQPVEGDAIVQKNSIADQNNTRWPDIEVQELITLRTSLEHKFQVMGPKGSMWEEISEAMHKKGFNRSVKKCKEKWENINKYYKRTVRNGKKRRQNSKACPYFDELDSLYRNGILIHGSASSNTNNVNKIENVESRTQ
ncbi:hypothetical protein Lal_00039043 [Lupinus albus]|uniref:Putative transcription factor MYB family n=1 Tax=Lupinus albus TaxID=3870 RepID=A0A6A5NLC7_LUPAL|nr:putative transcription factor MYB family [Lupinus albus]KAF1882395.1 hypothetical protein Lal_00039043 [Lupinus albus]